MVGEGVSRQHFGIISPPVSGHLHPFGALGRELMAQGHRVTVFQVPDLAEKIESEGLEFAPVGQSDYPSGALRASLDQLARLEGLDALRFTVAAVTRTTEMICRELPGAAVRAGITALLVDQMEPAGGAVAEHLGLPFITVCNALPLNRESAVPPPFTPWTYRPNLLASMRNRLGYLVGERVMRPVAQAVSRYRAAWGLPRLGDPEESYSRLAQITQLPREFDFPRPVLPQTFHYVGPMRRPHGRPAAFPWERLDGRPLVYASLGTLQNQRYGLFRMFAEACEQLSLQLVVAHGGGLSDEAANSLPGNPIAVSFAPQLEVLRYAALTLTHAGLNTVLDSLTFGVPLLAIPITYEQPAIASRIRWAGVGETMVLRQVSTARLNHAISRVLGDTGMKQQAEAMAMSIARSGGVTRAVAEIERIVAV